jgi:hypothetical protein
VLEGGWGLVLSLLVAVPFFVVFLNPAARKAALGEVAVVGAAIGVTGVLARQPHFLIVTLILLFFASLLAWMLRGLSATRRPGRWHFSPVVLPLGGAVVSFVLGHIALAAWLAVVGAVYGLAVFLSRWNASRTSPSRLPLVTAATGALPWIWYAADMIEAAKQGREPTDITMGLDHWPMMAALSIALVALAAWGAPVPAATAGIAAMAFGAIALAHPHQPASPGTAWGTAALFWGLVVLPWWLLRRQSGSASGEDSTAQATLRKPANGLDS